MQRCARMFRPLHDAHRDQHHAQTNYTYISALKWSSPMPQPVTTWIERHYLDVVDYALPANPTMRPPVNIPGALQGLSRGGALLSSLAQRPVIEGGSDSRQWLDATAHDGVDAHLGIRWPCRTRVAAGAGSRRRHLVAARRRDTNSPPALEAGHAGHRQVHKLSGAA